MEKEWAAAPRIERQGEDNRLILGDGRVIGFREYGAADGLPMLCFHGTPGSRFMFGIADEFARHKGLRLIAPERAGFGLSSFAKARPLARSADEMAALCDALGIERVAVAGVSGGAPFAVAFAAARPERVAAMGLVSPIGPFAGPESPKRIGPAHRLTFRVLPGVPLLYRVLFSFGRAGFLLVPDAMAALLISRSAPSDWRILSEKRVRKNLLRGLREGVRPGIGGAVEELRCFSRPWNLAFENITAPTILWQGLSDRNVPVSAALRLGELIPGCDVQRIEGAGHYWILRNYGHVLESVTRLAREAA
ncbi:alpha/beta fold hydrolase [Dichotomicrobium thermohalophilum]|uniref:Pimeloyl-ACP methyl ester carboxylesterase n=1 Tax=Dichotomicrobium thermohalophilum TaxID=933063 RepID=A0A397Q3U6_9HYPH|nr:alpha/beta fold hydrolase [Dichotomicrobium thermohalophilum]RIA56200.1 pimeloyl-ACP methyl ester carboxylesterase [Dichotomicrobium thermohalophilum]